MKNLRIILLLLVIALLFALTACRKQEAVPKIGLCLQGSTTFQPLQLALEKAGYQVIKQDAKNDQSKQTRQIEELLSEEIDLLIVEPVQTAAAGATLEQAKAAGVPIIFFNREPPAEVLAAWDKACYIGFDPAQPGMLQGQIVLQTATNGDINGDGIVTCIIIAGSTNHLDSQLHVQSCCSALTTRGIEVIRLDAGSGDGTQASGKRVCEYALSQYGKDVEVVFCSNNAMTLGAWTAIQEGGRTVGKDIYLLGIGADRTALDLVQKGSMTGTVSANQQGMSAQITATTYALLHGNPIETLCYIDYIKNTCE